MQVILKNEIAKPIKAKFGEQIFEMIGKPEELGGTTNHSFVHVVIPPLKSSPKHFHKISEETYYILKGSGKIVIDEQEFILEPGDACLIMPGEVHQIFNERDSDLEFLTISAPAWTPNDSFPVN